MEIYNSIMDIRTWFMDLHKWIGAQYMYQNTRKSGKLVRGRVGISVKNAQVMI